MKRLLQLSVVLTALLSAPPVSAQADFPSKPITVVVPSQAGGGLDLVARLAADEMSKHVGTGVVVDNRTGSGTVVGTQYAAAAAPDGYTLILGNQSNLVFNAALYKNLKYDPKGDFVNLGMVASYPYVMIARSDLPVQSYKSLIDLIQAQPNTLTIATAGPGTGQHILAAAFISATGAKVTIVPYKGAASAYNDILGGRVDLMIDAWPTVRTQLAGKRVKPMFTTGSRRLGELADIPTVKELGLPFLENESWNSISAPVKTSPAVIEKLRAVVSAATAGPEWDAKLEKRGMQAMRMSAPDADKYVAAQYDKWTTFIRQANIVAE